MADRNVLVTGAGSGIGRAVTERLLGKGYRVFAGAIDDREADTISTLPGRVVPLVFDVRDEPGVRRAAQEIHAVLGTERLTAVLNIAGVTTNGPLTDLDADTFTRVLAVNVVGMATVTRAVLGLLGPGSRVINMSSASGTRTLPFTGAYSASKFGVEALSTAMRMEFAPLGFRVVVIAPGGIDTPMADSIKHQLARTPSLPVYREPLRRFLATTEESFRTGVPLDAVVDTILTAVETPAPRRRYELHNNYLRDVVLMRNLPVGLREKIIRKTLELEGHQ
ncbi:SDR family NAD(P)-dependent oxidoreductase [Nocardia gamkensis]|uniref:SDR family oxidoreductase n=1 Tax=Nocardia gamkensis TaxID=352869 RepID=UPI0033FDC433